jgi:Fur family transcriptional regulator, ferric uptake regulator
MKENAFEKYGLKKTDNRVRILNILSNAGRPLTVDDIYHSFHKKDINLSTIYRCMVSFEKVGLVKREVNESKENVFSLAKKEDHHVLVCTRCHKRVPLKGCPFHEVNEKIESETGFLIQDQNIELYGLCKDCQKETKHE